MPTRRILYDLLRSGVPDSDREAWVRHPTNRPSRSSPQASGAVKSSHRRRSEVSEGSRPSHDQISGSQASVLNGRHQPEAWRTATTYQNHSSEISEVARSLEGNTAGGGSARPTGSGNLSSEASATRSRAMPFREPPSQRQCRPAYNTPTASQKEDRPRPQGRPHTETAPISSSPAGPRNSPQTRGAAAERATPSQGSTPIPRNSSLGMVARYFGLCPEDLFDCDATLERKVSFDYVDGSSERHGGWLRLNKGRTWADKVEGMYTFLEVEPMTCRGKVGAAELFGMLSETWTSLDESARDNIFSDSRSRHDKWLEKLRDGFERQLASTSEEERDSLCRQHVQTTMANFRPDDSEIQRLVQEERARKFCGSRRLL